MDHLQKAEIIQKNKETGDSQYIYPNEIDKACFQYDMAYEDFKDLTRRTASNKLLHDKAFNIAKNSKCDGYQRGLASTIYELFKKNSSGGAVKNESLSNQELTKQLHKPIIRKFKKRKVYSPFIDNVWGTDLIYMQLIGKFNKGIHFLLCAISIFGNYTWAIPYEVEKGIKISNVFQKILNDCKPNKIWVDKGSELDQWNHS